MLNPMDDKYDRWPLRGSAKFDLAQLQLDETAAL